MILDLLFPPRCPVCDMPMPAKERPVCRRCRGRVIISHYTFENGFAPFAYSGIWKQSILRFKYSGRAEYAGFFAGAILGSGMDEILAWRPRLILAVPVHAARLRLRGYNQAQEMAERLSARLGIPCGRGVLIRKKDTRPQNGLSPEGREENVRGAFGIREGARVPGSIMLVDDIYTTGSTVREITRVLRAAGCRSVHTVCACSARFSLSNDAEL